MKSLSIVAALAAAVAIAGCTPVKGPTAGGITASFKNDEAKSFVAGMQPAKAKAVRGEKTLPADCTIDSTKFAASFKSPATVNLPAYSKDPVPVTVSCTFEDETKTVVFKPKNLSAQARAGSAIGVAILCPICGVGYAAATAGKKENDIHGFSSLTVEFD